MAAAALAAGCASLEPVAQKDLGQTLAAHGAPPAVSLAERPDSARTRAAVAALLAQPLTPERAARVALVGNRRLRVALAAASFAEADLWQAARLPNPDFSATMRWPAGGGPATSTLAAGFDALDGLLIPLRTKLAHEALDAAERRAAQEALGLVAQVETACLVLTAKEEWRARLAVLHREDEARSGREAGRGRPVGAAHARAQAAETAAELAQVDGQLALERERLNQLMGLDGPPSRWRLAGCLAPVPAEAPDTRMAEAEALATRLDLAADRVDVALVRRACELERRTRLLPVGVKVGVESEKESSGQRLTGPTVRLGVPIFDQGQAEMLRLETALAQAEDRAAARETEIRAEARGAVAMAGAGHRLALTRRNDCLPQARRLWAESSRDGGTGPLALHWARRELITAERQEIEARRDYWLARVALAKAIGGRLEVAGPRSGGGGSGRRKTSAGVLILFLATNPREPRPGSELPEADAIHGALRRRAGDSRPGRRICPRGSSVLPGRRPGGRRRRRRWPR